jgi:hypothetical protein
MTDMKTELERASGLVDIPDGAFERLAVRRQRADRRQRLAALIVAGVVAAGSLGGLVALMGRLDERSRGAAARWEPGRRLELRPGEYFYLRVTSDEEAVDGWTRDVETWWAPDGSGEVLNRSTRQDKYPYPPSGVYRTGEFPEPYDVRSLSMDPEILAAQLREGTFEGHIALLLETPYASPDLRAAVFEVASALEGVRVIEDVRDPAGRSAIALETSERDGSFTATWRTYFDPGTHQPIAWTFDSSRGGSAWILLDSAIVDARGERPGPDEWLVPPAGEDAP